MNDNEEFPLGKPRLDSLDAREEDAIATWVVLPLAFSAAGIS